MTITARKPEDRARRMEDVAWLRPAGVQDWEMSARLGISVRTLEDFASAELPDCGEGEPDGWDLEWHAGEPDRRADRARPLAAALVRCVAASDGHGVGVVLERVRRSGDWEALAVVLAECASPARTAVVTGMAATRERVA